MTTSTRPNVVVQSPEDNVPSPPPIPEKKRHWLVPVAAGAVASGAGVGVGVGSTLTWRFSVWRKPS